MSGFQTVQRSELYTPAPEVRGLKIFNGERKTPDTCHRKRVLPLSAGSGRRETGSNWSCRWRYRRSPRLKKIEADRGRIALRYGPLCYNVETADHQDINQPIGTQPLSLEWKGDFLRGVMAIKGTWADGSPLLAIPNYTRMNRAAPTATPQSTR